MKYHRFRSPIILLSKFSSISSAAAYRSPSSTMSGQNRPPRNNSNKKEKRPPLTHFLCFPLVNETSLPQLEASLAKFQAAIPLRPKTENDHPLKPRPPLFPDAAVRPIGTLHLTLGVMSLPTPERLQEAVKLLQSLDLSSMLREAEARVRRPPVRRGPLVTPVNPDGPDSEPAATSEVKEEEDISLLQQSGLLAPAEPTSQERQLEPLSVSLESLHALPRARSATVLYASPVDATSRLYQFSVMLRDKFLEAGFLEGEYKKSQTKDRNPVQDDSRESKDDGEGEETNKGDTAVDSTSRAEETIIQQSLLEEVPGGVAEDPSPGTDRIRHRIKIQKPKPRPLLLHATVVNTIYARGGRRGNNNNRNNNNNKNNRERNNGPLTFDARGILSHYKDYYLDETRTQMRPFAEDTETEQQVTFPEDTLPGEGDKSTASEEEDDDHDDHHPSKKARRQEETKQKYPFVWAHNLPLERLCICEMGAKKLDADDGNALAARLGQEYRIVAERSLLDFGGGQQQQQQCDANDDDDNSRKSSVDGGVSIF